MVVSECSAQTPVRATKARAASAPPTFFRRADTTTYTSPVQSMSRPLTPKSEYMLTSSALLPTDIITLPPVAATANTPPSTTDTSLLPCEPRFLIRLVDDTEGRSRWTTPEAARDADAGSRFMPPYHPASRNVQGALQARAAQRLVRRTREAELRHQAEVDQQQQQEQTRPIFVVANAVAGTAEVVGRLASPATDGEETGQGEAAQQPASGGDDGAEDGEENGVDPDSMPHVGAACARCIEQQRRCNRRRPCQFCLREGLGEEGCLLPRADSDEPSSSLIQQPPVINTNPSVLDNVGETSKAQGKRKRKETATRPAAPAEQAPQAPPTFSTSPTLPTTPVQSTPPSRSSRNTTRRTGGVRQRTRPSRPISPMPYFPQNFLTDEQEEERQAWRERHPEEE